MKGRLLVAAVGIPLLLVILLVCPKLVTALALRREGTTEVLQWYRPGGALGLRRKTNGGR